VNSISVLIPVYHGEKYIDGLIRMFDINASKLKIKNQIEVHVVFINDEPKSSLQPSNYISPIYSDCVFLNPGSHQGIHGARVYGLKHTISDYVLFFDQDDEVKEEFLLSQYKKIGDADGIVCNGIYRRDRLIYSSSRPMEYTYDRKSLLEKQWNPLSPGQVLLRRSAVPIEQWSKYILKHNLTDDWLLWFLMINKGCKFNLNSDVIYKHCEDGSNSSQNWKEMGASRVEVLDVLRKLKVLTSEEDTYLKDSTDKYLSKYDKYIKLDELLESSDHKKLIQNIKSRYHDMSVAIYGFGVYGQKLAELLQKAEVNVSYGIDQHADAMTDTKIRMYPPSGEEFPPVDVVIITALFAFDEIANVTLKKMNCMKIPMDVFIKECMTAE